MNCAAAKKRIPCVSKIKKLFGMSYLALKPFQQAKAQPPEE